MRTARLLLVLTLMLGVLAAAAPIASAQACATTYVVQYGDTLSSIARRFGTTTYALAQANHIVNPNYIYAGQVLCIPSGTYYPPPAPPPAYQCTYYTVQRGDTLGSIAIKFGTTVGAIQQANGISNPNLIYAGQVLCIPTTSKPPSTSYPQWKGEYFNNMDLAGAPSLVRNDKAISFNWGLGWPDPKISADHFSVRWTRTLYFNAGTFQISAFTDDGVRVFVDNVLVIDQWHAATGLTYTALVTLATGNHTVRVEYYEDTGVAYAYVSFVRVTSTPGPTPTPLPTGVVVVTPGTTVTPGGGGTTGGPWTACYWSNQNMTLSGQPTMCQFEPAIAWNWGSGSPSPLISDDLFTGRWTGSSNFQAGTYRFNVIVDDGVRVYMDGKLIIDQWFNHAGTTITTNVSVTAGKHDLVVEYFEIGHDAQIYVWWEKIN